MCVAVYIILLGGISAVVYFRKEGCGLGEVTKYIHRSASGLYVSLLPVRPFSFRFRSISNAPTNPPPSTRYFVYNPRKRGSDGVDKYFAVMDLIADVEDIRFGAHAACITFVGD